MSLQESINPVQGSTLSDNKRTVHRIASALCVACNIPSGHQLVVLLGSGDESDNQGAIETWVHNALISLDESSAKDMLPPLIKRLGSELNQWEHTPYF